MNAADDAMDSVVQHRRVVCASLTEEVTVYAGRSKYPFSTRRNGTVIVPAIAER